MKCEFQWCFLGACYSERGDLHFWPHLRRRKQKPPRKTGKCSRRKGVTSIQFSLMLNAIGCYRGWAVTISIVRIPGICRPKVSPGATFHTFSGNLFQSIHITVICLQSLQQFFPCSWFQLSDLSHFFSSFEKLITRKFPPKHSWQKFQLSAGHWSEHSCTSVPSSSSLQLRGAPIGSCTRGGCDMQVGDSWKCGDIDWYNRIDSCSFPWFFHSIDSITFPFRLSLYWLLILKSPQLGNS